MMADEYHLTRTTALRIGLLIAAVFVVGFAAVLAKFNWG